MKWEVYTIHFHSDERIRSRQYEKILELIEQIGEFYVVIGDFNAISTLHEKEGGRMKPSSSIEGFNEFIIVADQ